jgi:hypothetical protein
MIRWSSMATATRLLDVILVKVTTVDWNAR